MKRKVLSLILVFAMLFSAVSIYGADTIKDPIDKIQIPTPIIDITKLELVKSVTFYCEDSTYVAEGAPTTNYNYINQNNLVVGSDEFAYKFYSMMKFSDITQAQGGLLPDEAEVTKATLMVYMNKTKLGDMAIKRCLSDYSESSVTWNSKPAAGSTVVTDTVSLGEGWKSIELPLSLVNEWIDTPSSNHGFYVQPSDASYGTWNFRSDDYGGYQPKLLLQYTGAEAVESPENVVPDDDIPCELTYLVTPSNPSPGEMMTITVTATDDTALEHVMIIRGSEVLAINEATDTSTKVLSVSYSEIAELPSMAYGLAADDIGVSQSIWENAIVPVLGTATAPTVIINATHYDVEEVVPVEYSFIKNDQQNVRIRVTATDPEGIKDLSILVNGRYHDYHYTDGRTTATEDVLFRNTSGTESLGNAYANNDTTFSYSAYARDSEAYTTSVDATTYAIAPVNGLILPYSNTPPFGNDGTNRLSWTRMTQVFGGSECWVSEKWNWKRLKAYIYYHAAFKDVADGGKCFGYSTMVTEFYNGRLTASDIQNFSAPYQLDDTMNNTVPYIEARQAAQLGSSIVIEKISQWFDADDNDAHTKVLSDVRSDLLSDRPGVLCIREGDSGHALVPWMVREMADGTTRIYVYDPNRTSACHNINANILTYTHFPYLTLLDNSWSYIFDVNNPGTEDDEIWNDKIFYYTYSHAIGGTTDTNNITTSSKTTTVTDHDIPTLIDALIGLISGDANMYMEDEHGNITGVKNGVYYEEIPGSMAISDAMGTSDVPSMFIVPDDIVVTAHITGANGSAAGSVNSGKYTAGLIQGASVFSIEDKALPVGGKDQIRIEPIPEAVKFKMTLKTDLMNSDCRIGLAEEIPGRVLANGDDTIGREFFLEKMQFDQGSSLSMYVADGAEQLVLAEETGDVQVDLTMRSTEILDLIGNQGGIILPESATRALTFTDDTPVHLTPESWVNTSESGQVVATETLAVNYSTASGWAIDEIEEAIAYGLTTTRVLSDFQRKITREEFCEIVVKLYEQLSGTQAPVVTVNPFSDTSNPMILQAYDLGIIKGVGNGMFAPESFTTRQEMCVMLFRTLSVAKPTMNFTPTNTLSFSDTNKIAEWAMDSVRFINQNSIMKGIGNNLIDPLGVTPREQAIVLLKRTYEAFK